MNSLILPVAGKASRMLGLPKYLLPYDNHSTLIQKHIEGALEAGFSQVIVAIHSLFLPLIEKQIFPIQSSNVTIVELRKETRTMNETIRLTLSRLQSELVGPRITIGLADSAYVDISYSQIYSEIFLSPHDYLLSLFEIRSDQVGKLGQVKIDNEGRVLDMKDKDSHCVYRHAWGNISMPLNIAESLPLEEPHAGVSFANLVRENLPIYGWVTGARYFDCGTLEEYKMFLNSS